ncbi:MAG: zinc-binding dehydrogenase, partial [Gammaproteobacteria bacterium]
IATDSQDVGERMRTETAGRGVDVILDTVAGSLMPRYFEGLAHDAKIFIVGALEGNYELTGPFLPLIQAAATIMGFSLYNNNRIDEQLARAKAFIGNAIAEKHLRPVIDRVVPFKDAIRKGYCDLAKGDQCGRIVVRVP